MTYCRNLGFEETPNYNYLKRLFRDLYIKCQFENEYIFDWTVQKFLPDGIDPDLANHSGIELPAKTPNDRSSTLRNLSNPPGQGSEVQNAAEETGSLDESDKKQQEQL